MANSMKQQILQSIANSQVQQALKNNREQEIAQLQADYDAWTKQQQGIAALQAEYDAWLGAQTPVQEQQPVQQKTVTEVKQLPKLEKPKSQEETKAFRDEKIAKREAVLKQKEAPKEKLIDNPFMGDYLSIKTQSDLGKSQDRKATSVDNWLDPSYKLSEDDKKAAREYARAELDKFDYNSSRQPVLKSAEDRQHYADMVNLLNKTNGLTNAMTGVIKQPLNLATAVGNAGRSIGNQLTGLGAAIGDKLGITEGATQRHNERVANKDAFYDQNEESMQRAYENAKTQNPVATTVGEVGGQIGMYALTNPLFDSLGAAAGLGKAGSFALNQVGQNAQDLALDTIPTLNQYLADDTLSDEEKKSLLANVGINAAGNLAMGGIGLGIDALRSNKAAREAADAAFRANVSEGAERLAKLTNPEDVDNVVRNAVRQTEEAAQNIDSLAKQIPETPKDIPSMEELRELELEANTMDNIEDLSDIWKQAQPEAPTLKKEGYTQPDYQEILDKYRAGERLTQYEDEALQSALLEEKYDNLRKYSDDIVTVEKSAIPDDVLKVMMGENYENMPESVKLSAALAKRGFNIWENGFNNNIMQNYSTLTDAVAHHLAADNIPAEVMAEAYEITYKNGGTLDDAIKLAADMSGTKLSNPTYGEGVRLSAKPAEAVETAAKTQQPKLDLPEETKDNMAMDFETLYDINADYDAVAKLNDPKVTTEFEKFTQSLFDYEKAAFSAENVEDITKAKKAVNAARKRLERAVKAADPNVKLESTKYKYGELVGKPEFRRTQLLNPGKATADDIIDSWVDYDVNRPNRWVRDAEPLEGYGPKQSVPGAEPLQFFGAGPDDAQWKISKGRTNSIEKLGWGDQMPEKNFAYRVYSEAEQRADAAARYQNSKNVVADLMNKSQDEFDAPDVKMAYSEAQRLMDQNDRHSVLDAQYLMQKTFAAQREGGRVVQAGAEFTRNTASGAVGDALKMEEDTILNPWKSRNAKVVEGNNRIAKALADMGHKADVKEKPPLTHDQIKNGVLAELNKEVGSVEKYFNENDIEYLTQLAEDKSIPVWQITSEIEHKLKTGNWYSLDESLPVPQPTNKKLQNALNSLIETEVRQTEKAAPTLQQITEEVRNTLAKEFAESDETLRLFGDDDIEYLAHLIDNGATKQEIANALDHKLAKGTFGISSKTIQQVNNIFKEISRFDPNSKQFVEGQAEAYRLLANEVVGDATPLEKFEAWRYLAMLGNPKTMLRNFIGNKTFGVVTGVSNNLAALAEAGIDKGVKALGGEGIQRTKSILNPLKDADLIKASFDDADISRYRQMIGSKYEKMNADTLRRSKSVFNSKFLQFYEKVTDAGISDYKAVKNKFSTSLAGYLKANGYDTSIFKAEDELARLKNLGETRLLSDAEKANIEKLTKDVEALEKARDFALKQAEYAAFHEDNAVATALTRASTYLRTSDNKVLNGLGAMLEGVVPFKKTPMNVLKSGLEYSPLGAIDSIKKTGKLIYENTGKRAGNLADTYINSKGKEVTKTLASDVIDSWAKTLTGSGLTALGFYLYDKGILNSSDKDLKYQDQLEGKQNYSLTINGKTYTIDWAAPTAMPLLLGAEVAKVWRDSGNDVENWYDHLDEYLNAANRLADPLIETSMLQGVKDTLDTAANAAKYDENLNIPTLIGYNTLTGYLTQGIPTISGQIARTVDNTRRSTYTDKEGVAGTLEKQGRKLMNKIPGLSTLNQPYIDTYGREQANSPFGNPIANLAYQMASPGYLADINETPADTMARDVYEKSGKADNILPKWNSYFKDSEGKRVSPEDFTQASRVAGEVQAEVRNALANDDWFNGLSDADKTDIVNDINTIAANMGKSSIDPEFENSNKSYVAYKEGGLKGLMDHFKNRYASNVAKESGLNSSTKAAQAIKEDVMNGNTEAAQQKIDAATSLQDLGLTKPGPSATYYNAQSVIPGLTTEDFAKTYKAIDSDGNQGIKQDEVIAYLNKKKITSESEAKKIWSAYGNSSWKSIPKLEDGTWKKKKK